MDVTAWLRKLGLEQYEPAFRENKISADLLPSLTAEDLKDLGVSLVGDRRRLLSAIAALQSLSPAERSSVAEAPPAAAAQNTNTAAAAERAGHEAERRQLTVLFCDLVGSTELSAASIPRSCSS